MLTEMKVKDFIAEVASNSPAPGGGSVAALSAASGAGLLSMLANLTRDKKGYEAVHSQMGELADYCTAQAAKFVNVINEDTAAFDKYMDAIRLPKDTDEDKVIRSAAMQKAAEGATNVPLNLARDAYKLMEKARFAIKNGNANALSDGAVAVLMLRTATLAALYNVRINLGMLKNQELVAKIAAEADQIDDGVKALEADLLSEVKL